MIKKGLLIVISGPSGAGKGTVCRELLKDKSYWLSVSATTRLPREGEIEGTSYFFLGKETFLEKLSKGNFLEYAEVYGNYYGTPKDKIEDKLNEGIDVILEIDIQGALKVKDICPEGVFIFIMPPSMEELKNRIIGRGSETEESLNLRFKSAFQELNYVSRYNYVVINDIIEDAVSEIKSIITAEKCRVDRQKDLCDKIGGLINE
ncbi:guanylate kinase [Hathewaya massiliensis]|uniref:guanylate kinase n=1 Tax=Hathewaya massiliensis TaxID=1964382 RepID=UPI00115B522C|nr:guanylate kinase [Hathewaya massiliensis]